VDLNFILDAFETRVISTLKVVANPEHSTGGPLILSGEQLSLKSVRLNGQELTTRDFSLDEESLTLLVPPNDATFELKEYRLYFETVREMFNYIKKSGVSGGDQQLTYTQTKQLMKQYPLDYLEFEVLFVKGVSLEIRSI
jgi:aminopeptidase N